MSDDFKNQLNSYLKKAEKELYALGKAQNFEDTITSIGVINDQCLKNI